MKLPSESIFISVSWCEQIISVHWLLAYLLIGSSSASECIACLSVCYSIHMRTWLTESLTLQVSRMMMNIRGLVMEESNNTAYPQILKAPSGSGSHAHHSIHLSTLQSAALPSPISAATTYNVAWRDDLDVVPLIRSLWKMVRNDKITPEISAHSRRPWSDLVLCFLLLLGENYLSTFYTISSIPPLFCVFLARKRCLKIAFKPPRGV